MIVNIGKTQLFKINPIPIIDLLLILYISSVIIFSMIPVGNIISKLIGLTLLFIFVINMIVENKNIKINREMRIGAVWIIFCILSALVATNVNFVVVKVFTLLQLSLFFVAAYSIILNGKIQLKVLLYTFLLSVFFIYLYGFINQYNPAVLVTKNRITATVGDPNILSVYGAFAFIIALFLLKVEKHKIVKISIIVITLIILYGIVLTQSRQGILISIIGFIIYSIVQIQYKYIHNNNQKRYLLKLILYLILFGLFFSIVIFIFKTSDYSYRLQALVAFIKLNITSSNDRITRIIDYSAYERKQLIKYATQIWLDNPILGVGLDNFRVIIKKYNPIGNRLYAHNNYLELLSTIGTIGAAIYYAVYGSIIAKLIKLQKKLANNSLELLIVQLFLTVIFSLMVVELFTVTYYTKFTWIILLLIIAYTDKIIHAKHDTVELFT